MLNKKNETYTKFLTGPTRSNILTLDLLLLFVLMSFYMILFQPIETTVAFSVIDDGMYYPKIALNLASRGILSFDGVTVTNGFHPLWMIILIPLYFLVSEPMLALRFTFIYIFLILTICCFLLSRICRYLKFSPSGTFVAFFVIILNLRSFTILYSLLESHVVLLAYLIYIHYSLTVDEKRFTVPIYSFINGLLIGVCFLARLDASLLAVGYGLTLLYRFSTRRQRWATFWRSALCSSFGFLVVATPYLLFNIHYFGHVETVSMYMKSRAISPEFLETIFDMFRDQFVPRIQYVMKLEWLSSSIFVAGICAAAAAGIIYCLYMMKRRKLYRNFLPIIDFGVFVVIDLSLVSLMVPQEIMMSAWYMLPGIVFGGLILGACTPDVKVMERRLIPAVIVILVLIQVWTYTSYVASKKMTFAKLEVANFIRSHLPEHIRGSMYDAGIVSYFSQRDFVALNGLIGDFEMAELARNKRMKRLAEKYGVNYLVIDILDNFLPELSQNILYQSATKMKFTDFLEPPKRLVLYHISPDDLEKIWERRYGIKPILPE